VLDIEQSELRRGAEPVALEPQVSDLLVYLVRNRGRVVSKDDLIQGVWGGRIVSDSALTARLNAAHKAVNDNIRTVHRKRVRFIAKMVSRRGRLIYTAKRSGFAPLQSSEPCKGRLFIASNFDCTNLGSRICGLGAFFQHCCSCRIAE
jgi:DNA-binding response OmpR family regulator